MGWGRVGLVLADVAGKGIAAALLMANLQASLRSHATMGSKDLAQVLASVNHHFYKHTETHCYAKAALRQLRAQSAPAVAQGQRGADDGDRHGNRIVPGLGVLRRGSSFGI